jgi:hypothetical protein
MSIFSRSGGYLAAVLVVCGIAFFGISSPGLAGTQPLNRQQTVTLAHSAQATLQAHEARVLQGQRAHLQKLVRRTCAARERRRCARNRAALARLDARAARFLKQAKPIYFPTTPTKSSSGTAGSSGSGTSGSGSTGGSGTTSGSGTGSGTGSTGGSGTTSGSGTGSGSGSTGSGSEPPASSVFQPGIVAGTNMTLDVQGAVTLGAKLVRIEFPIETPAAQMESVIAGYAAKGIRVAPLASFRGRLPSPAEAQNLASWAKTYGPEGSFWAGRSDGRLAIQTIEFGNETSYGYQYGDGAGDRSYAERAEGYARRFKEAAQAIEAAGIRVGLLAQDDDWTGDWMNGMYNAVPDLSRYVAGWVIHPYHRWRSRIESLVEQTAAHGAPSSIPVDVTEFGLPTDNGKCLEENEEYNRCMSYGEAASILRSTVSEMRQLLNGRLGIFMLYQVRDQRLTGTSSDSEYFYGALQHELQPKGEYTSAVQALMASS